MNNPFITSRKVLIISIASTIIFSGCSIWKNQSLETLDNISVLRKGHIENNDYYHALPEFTNKSNRIKNISYRIQWLDSRGKIVEEPTSWTTLQLNGKETRKVQTFSNEKMVNSYIIEMHDLDIDH